MISIQQQNDLLNVAVFGEFTLKDFQDFEANALYTMKFQGPVSVLLDLRDMHGYTLDMAWEEWRPDGTVQYAENPPKKYQDILPFNFETEDWEVL